jgi:hypothetical protein
MSQEITSRTENPFGTSTAVARQTGALVSVEQQRAIAETQARYLIARANPRDPMRAVDAILQDCMRPSLAESALYAYNRGGTDITGPTIRLAEAIARRWGNVASGIKEIARHGEYSECVAYAHDLETGYYDERQFQVRHWRDTKKGGYLVKDERDIYEMIANFGQRRKRAVLLSVIPGDVVETAVEQCERTLHAKADTSPEGIRKMLEVFASIGVSREQIEARCQRRVEALHPAQIVQLRKIFASVRDGMSEARDWFNVIDMEGEPQRGNAGLRERLRPQNAVSTEAGDPEPKPREAHMETADLAGSSSEAEVELAAGAGSRSGARGEEDEQNRASADETGGSPVLPGMGEPILSSRAFRADLALRTTAEIGTTALEKLWRHTAPEVQAELQGRYEDYQSIAKGGDSGTP